MSLNERLVIASLKVLPQRAMSHLAGVLFGVQLPSPLARASVRTFGRLAGVNFEEVREPLESFASIQSFFVRYLKDGLRPVDAAPDAFVSPCDGAVGSSGTIADGLAIQVKGKPYAVAALLDDEALAKEFEGGTFATLYLSPRDYHRFHAPCDGTIESARHVPGALWPVNAAGLHHVDGLFAKNERIIAHVRPTFAPGARLALVAVGATMVGKVRVTFDDLTTNTDASTSTVRTYNPAIPLAKGAEWGHFAFGSTIVVLASRGFLDLSLGAPGTPLVLGSRIGTCRA